MTDLSSWQPPARPARQVIEGRYARLEPLDPQRHTAALFAASRDQGGQIAGGSSDMRPAVGSQIGADQASGGPTASNQIATRPTEADEARFRYLFDAPPQDLAEMQDWVTRAAGTEDPLFFAVIDRATGQAEGRQALMRIEPQHGVVEIGSILWGPRMARSRIATEALFLAADQIFAAGYRRFEWKCDTENLPSKKAALRFGFQPEGVFRQHFVTKGRNRDTAWFSILDRDWPDLRREYLRWLSPENFDPAGQERSKLRF